MCQDRACQQPIVLSAVPRHFQVRASKKSQCPPAAAREDRAADAPGNSDTHSDHPSNPQITYDCPPSGATGSGGGPVSGAVEAHDTAAEPHLDLADGNGSRTGVLAWVEGDYSSDQYLKHARARLVAHLTRTLTALIEMAISREDGSGRLRAAVEDLFKQLKHYQVDHALLQQTHTEAIAELAWLRTLVCCPTLEITRRAFLLRAERSRERMEREYPEEYSQVTLGDVSRVIAELRAVWSQAVCLYSVAGRQLRAYIQEIEERISQDSEAPFGIFDEFSLLSGGIQYLKEQLMAAPPTPVRLGKAHTGEGESSERGTPRRRLDDE